MWMILCHSKSLNVTFLKKIPQEVVMVLMQIICNVLSLGYAD